MRLFVGIAAVVAAGVGLATTTHANVLVNPGFESDFASWNTGVGDPAPTMNVWRIATWSGDLHTGDRAAVLDVKSTVDTGGGSYWNLVSQVVNVTAGQAYNASAWQKTAGLAGHSQSWIEVQFLDSANQILQQYQSAHVSADQSYTLMNVTASGNVDLVAPANATAVRIQGVVEQFSAELPGATEWHVFDDFSLSAVPEPGVGVIAAGIGAVLTMRRRRVA